MNYSVFWWDTFEISMFYVPLYGLFHSECLNGNVTCFEDFVPDVQGRLNDTQLSQFISLLQQFYYFENSQEHSYIMDIRTIPDIIEGSKSNLKSHALMNKHPRTKET